MTMRKFLLSTIVLFCASFLNAQNVGIGTLTPNASAMLEINAANKGLLIPRVNLLSPTDVVTIPSPAAGLQVISLNSNTGQMPDGAGLYVWTGKWSKVLLNEVTNNTAAWTTRGNAGTNVDSNFVGTTDNKDVIFKRNNTRAVILGATNTSWGVFSLNPATTGLGGNTAIGDSAL